ncbi:YdeI/OmpD-associated family protein [Massilia endophytica]|uniref:YdeI/OmpD-associated family protein n=1 Tax=Massilia endophytica TaxID=2899220 RepID=UPI001E45CFC5|nr:DUF1801 domain-containing protein [Massilia endophytica]UGQ48324.1 YdeI/OmpD-associated family protein [Massilia endophytica]
MNPKVDAFLSRQKNWKPEFEELRSILLDCPLTEELKWGVPCYALDGKNVVLMHGFKEYCALLFFKGALMKDGKGILVTQTENTQSTRQIRFTGVQEIVKMKSVLKAYIKEAIEIEKAGLKVEFKETAEFNMPDEFRFELQRNPALRNAFEALTPGRQRGYLLHFSAAKLSKTREARIEKCTPRILDGMGLND